jgi:hypothetical protein
MLIQSVHEIIAATHSGHSFDIEDTADVCRGQDLSDRGDEEESKRNSMACCLIHCHWELGSLRKKVSNF